MKVNGTVLVFALLSAGVLTVTTANAQLVSIDGHLAVYDPTANISWLADANLAATNTFGVSGINPDGSMSYTTAQNWITAMNAANYLGKNTWSLPTTASPDPSCSLGSPAQAFGYDCVGSMMGYLYYQQLGGVMGSTIELTHNASYLLFKNFQPYLYWSATVYPPVTNSAWSFSFGNGFQGTNVYANDLYAMAFAPGKLTNTTIATHDFNGDGYSDIAWRQSGGTTAIWLMNGATVIQTGSLGMVPSGWQIVGQRDFNADGKADWLWRDGSGNIVLWFMNGIVVASSASLGNVPTTWTIVGTGDFNGDGYGDILWRDSSGDMAMWLMNGATVVQSGSLGNVPTNWTVAGVGDFNGDGMADILWRDPTAGSLAIWFMNGVSLAQSGSLGTVPTNWSVVGTGDFNGDGMSDIVWRDNLGNTSIWLMNGAAVLSAGGLGKIPTTWSIVQTGDYNGDGMSDLLWRDGSGNTAMWFMNGTTIASTAAVGNIPTSWTVQSVNAE